MTTLSRFQMAAIKRTAQNVKSFNKKKTAIETKIQALTTELEEINRTIESWEEPIKLMTGGKTSTQILATLNVEEDASISEDPATETNAFDVPESPDSENSETIMG